MSSKLVEIAKDNLKKVITNGLDWEVVCSDAGKWNGYDNYNIFYIYNSFPKAVMEEVKNKLNESIRNCPREVTVWYLYPEFPEVFLEDKNWKMISRGSCLKLRHGMHVFKNTLAD